MWDISQSWRLCDIIGIYRRKEVAVLKLAFTGHRPEGRPFGENETAESCRILKRALWEEIVKRIGSGYAVYYLLVGTELLINRRDELPDTLWVEEPQGIINETFHMWQTLTSWLKHRELLTSYIMMVYYTLSTIYILHDGVVERYIDSVGEGEL